MPTLTTHHVVLQRLGQWSAEQPPFREAAVEAVLLFDLFRGVLGFNTKSAKRQVRAADKTKKVIIGRTDIVLHLRTTVKVVVEVKRFDTFDSETKTTAAIKRAAEYMRIMGQEYGVVTDGITWIYFRVKRHANYHQIHRLIRFSIKKQPSLALIVLKRSHKGTLGHLFELLVAMHENMTEVEFIKLMDQSQQERAEELTQKIEQGKPRFRIAEKDRNLILALYASNVANECVKPLLKPIKLTKS